MLPKKSDVVFSTDICITLTQVRLLSGDDMVLLKNWCNSKNRQSDQESGKPSS